MEGYKAICFLTFGGRCVTSIHVCRSLKVIQWEVPTDERVRAGEVYEGVWMKKAGQGDGDEMTRLTSSLSRTTLMIGEGEGKEGSAGLDYGSGVKLLRTRTANTTIGQETGDWTMHPRKTISPAWDPHSTCFVSSSYSSYRTVLTYDLFRTPSHSHFLMAGSPRNNQEYSCLYCVYRLPS